MMSMRQPMRPQTPLTQDIGAPSKPANRMRQITSNDLAALADAMLRAIAQNAR